MFYWQAHALLPRAQEGQERETRDPHEVRRPQPVVTTWKLCPHLPEYALLEAGQVERKRFRAEVEFDRMVTVQPNAWKQRVLLNEGASCSNGGNDKVI